MKRLAERESERLRLRDRQTGRGGIAEKPRHRDLGRRRQARQLFLKSQSCIFFKTQQYQHKIKTKKCSRVKQ